MKRERINQVCGIPVEFDPDSRRIADARGLWPFAKKIVVGPQWLTLSHRERLAVLYHEAGHCFGKHMEIRVLMLPLFLVAPWFVIARCHAQEMESDEFAAENGFGLDLARLLRRTHEMKHIFYPSHEARLQRLKGANHEEAQAAD